MERLFVFADFNWLDRPELVGELCYEKLRGSDSYAFKYDENWLKVHAGIQLSEDISNYPGMQYTQPGSDIFGCFSDALPDRWGRTLLKRREQIQAAEEKRAVRTLSSFDYLMGIDDFSRMGGFRFKREFEGDYINVSPSLKIPPMTELRELVHASQEVEISEENDVLPEKKWIAQLIQPGSSLGGARPKAGVLDENGNLCIAKFPARKDDYDAGLWEHFSHLLAQKAGIQVAQTRVLGGLGKYHTLLSKRFDRTAEAKRIHFASSMSLLGLKDGDNAQGGYGYLDIVDFILAFIFQALTDFGHLVGKAVDSFWVTDVVCFYVRLRQKGIVHLQLWIEANGSQWWQKHVVSAIITCIYVVSHEAPKIRDNHAIVAQK